MTRLLLAEVLDADPQRHHMGHKVEYFPYLRSLALERGWEVRWRVIRIPSEFMHVGDRMAMDLPASTREALAREIERFRPDSIVFHDLPVSGLEGFLRERFPGIRISNLTGRFGGLTTVAEALERIGATPDEARVGDGRRMLLDLDGLSFERSWLDGGGFPGPLPIRIAGTAHCPHRAAVRQNPYFAGLDTPAVSAHTGCSFCGRGLERPDREAELPPVERDLRQIEAYQRAYPGSDRPFEVVSEDMPHSTYIVALLEAALGRGLRPFTFVAMPRADHLVQMRERLEAVLPRMRDAGHAVQVLCVAVESFSAAENQRFNKALSADKVWECHELMRDFTGRFPGTFRVDPCFFVGILFTPWTLPDDLRENLRAARTLGSGWLQRMVGSRLQLFDGVPLLDLARSDGLCPEAEELPEDWESTAQCDPNRGEILWRFADERTARIRELLVRLDPVPSPKLLAPNDRLRQEVRAEQARLPAALAQDYVALVAAIVDAVDKLGPDASTEAIFDEVGR